MTTLTDADLQSIWMKTATYDTHLCDVLVFARAIIAAHDAKQAGEAVMVPTALLQKLSASMWDYKAGADWGKYDADALHELDALMVALEVCNAHPPKAEKAQDFELPEPVAYTDQDTLRLLRSVGVVTTQLTSRKHDPIRGKQVSLFNSDQMREAVAKYAEDAERLKRIAWLIGSIFVHGNFKAETYNERELEKLLRENGTFWESLADFDAARGKA